MGRQRDSRDDRRDDSTEILCQSFSAEGSCEQFWHGQGCPLFDVVRVAFPLPTAALPTLKGALKDSFREDVVACDMPEPCTFPSLSFKSQETIVYQTTTDYRRQIC